MISILLLSLLGHCSHAASAIDFPIPQPSEAKCKIARAYFMGLTPEELCTKNQGIRCQGVTSMPKAICMAGKASYCDSVKSEGEAFCLAFGGSLCNTVQNFAQGICLGLNAKGYCNQLKANQDNEWKSKLKNACI
jgi:hypothetical protein